MCTAPVKTEYTEEEQLTYCLTEGPAWSDGCEHGAEYYVASFEVPRACRHNKTYVEEKFDLYLFPDPHYGTEVCIRYGNEDSEYISPGGLGEFLQQANATWHYSRADIYHYAAKFLLAFGKVHWERRIKDVKS